MSQGDQRPDGIAILDFGGQYCHLIARRVREMNVYSEILPCDATVDEIRTLDSVMNLRGIILSGSPASLRLEDSPRLTEGILKMGLPLLGLCYGHQLISQFKIPSGGEGPTWAHPVVCGGRLYIRHSDRLFAYDVRAEPSKPRSEPASEQ